jgi:hypothetical protein
MRGYMQLLDFMRELADGIQEHLPAGERMQVMTLEEIVDQWMAAKSYWAIRSLRRDIRRYVSKHTAGDYEIDEIFAWYDLLFVPERFGCDERELLSEVLHMIEVKMIEQPRSVLDDLISGVRRVGRF